MMAKKSCQREKNRNKTEKQNKFYPASKINLCFISENKINTQELSAVFEGTVGETYKFFSVAIDNVHHIESDPAQYDAITRLTVDAEEIEMIKEGLTVYPNPTNDFINIKITNAPCNVFIVEIAGINGSVNYSEIFSSMQIQNGINIDVNNFEAGQYFVKIIYGNENVVRKIIVQ